MKTLDDWFIDYDRGNLVTETIIAVIVGTFSRSVQVSQIVTKQR